MKIKTELRGLGLDLQMRNHLDDVSNQLALDLTPLVRAFLDSDLVRLEAITRQSLRIRSQLNDSLGTKVKTLGICLASLASRADSVPLMEWLEGYGVDTMGVKFYGACNIGPSYDLFTISPLEDALQRGSLRILTHWRESHGADFIRSSNHRGYPYISMAAQSGQIAVFLHLLELDSSVVEHRFAQLTNKTLTQYFDDQGNSAMASVIRSWQAQRAARSVMDELKQSKPNLSAHLD